MNWIGATHKIDFSCKFLCLKFLKISIFFIRFQYYMIFFWTCQDFPKIQKFSKFSGFLKFPRSSGIQESLNDELNGSTQKMNVSKIVKFLKRFFIRFQYCLRCIENSQNFHKIFKISWNCQEFSSKFQDLLRIFWRFSNLFF